MRIISDKQCYVQGYDLEFMAVHDKSVEKEEKDTMLSILEGIALDDYIKITDNKLIECIIKNENLFDFSENYNLKLKDLLKKELKLEIDLMDFDDYDETEIENYKYERIKKKYLLSQLKELMKYKNRESKCNFPNVPNPCITPIVCDNLLGNLSLDYDNVLIYKNNDELIDSDNDDLCYSVLYKFIMQDQILNYYDDVKLEKEIINDGKYLCVSSKEMELCRKNRK